MQRGFCKGDGVAFAGELCPASAQDVQKDRVALQRLRRKAGDGHAAAHRAQHRRERGLAVVALHGVIAGMVVLIARQEKGVLVQPPALHTKSSLHRAGHVDVAAAFHRRDEVQGAVAGKQRQREQQPADKLAGHVARQPVFAGSQGSFHGQTGRTLLKP